jgi:hypothetical protein
MERNGLVGSAFRRASGEIEINLPRAIVLPRRVTFDRVKFDAHCMQQARLRSQSVDTCFLFEPCATWNLIRTTTTRSVLRNCLSSLTRNITYHLIDFWGGIRDLAAEERPGDFRTRPILSECRPGPSRLLLSPVAERGFL